MKAREITSEIMAKILTVSTFVIKDECKINKEDRKQLAKIFKERLMEVAQLLEESDDGFEVDLVEVKANLIEI